MPQDKTFFVYIMSNHSKSTLYTGMTNDLIRRVHEHKQKLLPGFSQRYHTDRLVYFETLPTAETAIAREKQIKGGSRAKKIALISQLNENWKDLYEDICN